VRPLPRRSSECTSGWASSARSRALTSMDRGPLDSAVPGPHAATRRGYEGESEIRPRRARRRRPVDDRGTRARNGAARIVRAAAATRRHVSSRQRDQARDLDPVRQHSLPAGPRQRPVGSRADAAPAQLHPLERNDAHERPHGPHLAYRDRDPVDADRRLPGPLRRSGLEQLPLLHAERDDQDRRRVRLLDGAALRPRGPAVPASGADRPLAGDDQRERRHLAGAVGAPPRSAAPRRTRTTTCCPTSPAATTGSRR